MDETAIKLYQAVRAGHLTFHARALKRSARSLTTSATASQTRGMFTLVAFVCDDEMIQNVLPQICLVNEKHLTKAEPAAALRAYLDANSVLWTSSKAWVTSTLMCKIVKLLKKHLQPFFATHHFILTADGYRAHLTKPVWGAVNRARIMYHLIPAKMTWILQPCDSHVFAVLKNTLQHECQSLVLKTVDGRLTMSLLFQALARSILVVLRNRSWRTAFWDVGLTGTQAAVSDHVLAKLGLHGRPRVDDELPSLQELQAVFPGRVILPIVEIFEWFTFSPAASPIPRPASAHVVLAMQSRAAHHPLVGRLSSSSALDLDSAPHAASAAPCPAMMPKPNPPRPPPATLPSAVPRGRRLLPWRPRLWRPLLPPAP